MVIGEKYPLSIAKPGSTVALQAAQTARGACGQRQDPEGSCICLWFKGRGQERGAVWGYVCYASHFEGCFDLGGLAALRGNLHQSRRNIWRFYEINPCAVGDQWGIFPKLGPDLDFAIIGHLCIPRDSRRRQREDETQRKNHKRNTRY